MRQNEGKVKSKPNSKTYPFLCGKIAKVQCSLVPVDGQVGRGEGETAVGAGQGTPAAEAVPLAARAPRAVLLHQLQGERILLAEAVITGEKNTVEKEKQNRLRETFIYQSVA